MSTQTCPDCERRDGVEVDLIYQHGEMEVLSGRATVQQYEACYFCPECESVFEAGEWDG